MTSANLSDLLLASTSIVGANLTNAKIEGAHFGNQLTASQLYSTASYQNRILRGVGLSETTLFDWNLSDQDLRGAALSSLATGNTDLSRADLRHAQLLNVDLSGAILTDANLSFADLRGTVGLPASGDIDLRNAILPDARIDGLVIGDEEWLSVNRPRRDAPLTVRVDGQLSVAEAGVLELQYSPLIAPFLSTLSVPVSTAIELAGTLRIRSARVNRRLEQRR